MLWLCTRQWPWNIEHDIIIHTLQLLKESFPTTKTLMMAFCKFMFWFSTCNRQQRPPSLSLSLEKVSGCLIQLNLFLVSKFFSFFMINLNWLFHVLATLGFLYTNIQRQRQKYKNNTNLHLLWRHVKGNCSQVDFPENELESVFLLFHKYSSITITMNLPLIFCQGNFKFYH